MDRYRVAPGSDIDLKDWDPDDLAAFPGDKGEARDLFEDMVERIAELLRDHRVDPLPDELHDEIRDLLTGGGATDCTLPTFT